MPGYGNFGQANYGAASRMTEGLMPEQVLKALEPGEMVPAMLVTDRQGETVPLSGSEQEVLEVCKAIKAHGVSRA